MTQLPLPGETASLWVVDGNHPFWDALTWTDQLMGNTTKKVFSVADLIAACAHDAINNSRTIDCLAILGHGTDGYQSVGAGQSFEETGTKSLLYRGIVARGGS